MLTIYGLFVEAYLFAYGTTQSPKSAESNTMHQYFYLLFSFVSMAFGLQYTDTVVELQTEYTRANPNYRYPEDWKRSSSKT